MRGTFPRTRGAANQILDAHRFLPTNKTPFLCVSLRPAQCSAPEDVLCWLSAPCWPSSPSSCPLEDVRGGSAPWRATCKWLQVRTHICTHHASMSCTKQDSFAGLVEAGWWSRSLERNLLHCPSQCKKWTKRSDWRPAAARQQESASHWQEVLFLLLTRLLVQ